MSGIYVHVPFCRKACTYCDFHFSTSLGTRERVLAGMQRELDLRIAELDGAPVGTLYFGGGTPSLLPAPAIAALIGQVRRLAPLAADAEITLEANPDDITPQTLEAWTAAGITRVSLGIQSFRDERLRWMGRAHDAGQALRSIGLVARAGLASWTIDLIYGLPGMTLAEWDEQLSTALDHGMPHLSAYCLTVEERTALHRQVAKGLVHPANDAEQADQFEHLTARMEAAGLVPYEISNFGREDHFSRHNTAYWQGVPYLGIGPAAHSFNGAKRRWNVANNIRYAEGLERGSTYWEEEQLTPVQRVNERLLTGLRTMWGVDLRTLGTDLLEQSADLIRISVERGDLLVRDDRLVLTRQGRNFADRIASDLFLTDDR
ncbi:MAG: radical SAM family heme chaperone HemW [Bacteroidetes bacterium]|nr:radical SAM family heme chaperone HemW [Bacteroidota bacterium]